ncbi:hypothetical protein HDU97_003027 [Phlyctochytrium planicorne]|nr:hypothetical protein HDU97_003027 [Phlyctochytrium planicorne]
MDEEYENDNVEVVDEAPLAWTKEETRAVMKFYGLKTLDLQVWEDEETTSPTSKQQQIRRNRMSAGINTANENPAIGMDGGGDDTEASDMMDPLGIRSNIFGKGKRRAMHNPSNQRLLISNKNFDSVHFLKTVHGSTSYRDLDNGAKNLRVAIEKRTDVIKQLVKQHFAKFVNAKSTIDSLTSDASELYNPVLQRRDKADRLRAALGILEQWKFFFNLPSVLQENIKKKNFDAAVRDYNKGKYLMESSFTESTSDGQKDGGTEAPDSQNLLPKNHRKVFEKVWAEVEKSISAFKENLFRQLDNRAASLDEQERIMTHLVELSADKDPIWTYLTAQYEWIISQLMTVYRIHVTQIEAILALADSEILTEAQKIALKSAMGDKSDDEIEDPAMFIHRKARKIYGANEEKISIKRSGRLSLVDFKRAVSKVQTKQYEVAFAEDLDLQLWKAVLRVVKDACKVMRKSLQDFWRLCRIYSEDRIQKSKTFENTDPQNPKPKRRADVKKIMQCQSMLKNIAELYSNILSNAFHLKLPLSKIHQTAREQQAIIESRNRRSSSISSARPFRSTAVDITIQLPDETQHHHIDPLPVNASSFLAGHPLTSCHFAVKLMSELVRCFDDIRSMRVGGGTTIEERMLRAIGETADAIKKRVTESICDGVVFESRKFYEYEDWSFDADPRSRSAVFEKKLDENDKIKQMEEEELIAISADATQLIKLFYRFLKFNLRCLERVVTAPVSAELPGKASFGTARGVSTIFFPGATDLIDTSILPVSTSKTAGSSSSATAPDPPVASRAVPPVLLEKVVFTFTESCLGLLDGFEWLATRWTVIEEEDEDLLQALEKLKVNPHSKLDGGNFHLIAGEDDISKRQKGNIALLEKKRKAIDTRKIDSRSLVIICNLVYLKNIVIPKLVALIELKYKTNIAKEVELLNDIMDHLDFILYSNYIRRKAMRVSGLIRHGILYSGLDFNDLARLQEIRSYCYDTLMIFVLAHSEVSDASRRLIKRVLSGLLVALGNDLLHCLREVDKFGVAGKLQAKLETEFLHKTLLNYETDRTKEVFKLIYDTIEQRSETVEQTPAELLDNVKGFLEIANEATAMQFICFKERGAIIEEEEEEEEEVEDETGKEVSIGR